MRLALEILLGIASLFLGSMWWGLLKRDAYLKRAVQDETVLNGLTRELLEAPPARIAIWGEKCKFGYARNLQVLVEADKQALRIPKLLHGVPLVLLLVGSYFLGWTVFAANLGLVCLAALPRVPDSAKANTLEQVASIAVILYRWNAENPAECDAFIQKAYSLSKLYSAVLRVTESEETRKQPV